MQNTPRKARFECAIILSSETAQNAGSLFLQRRAKGGRPVTAKQQRFCEEYLIDLNATRAAIRAGYSPKSAKTNGPRLLENAGVRARVEAMMARLSRRTGVSAERVVRELARVAFASMPDVVDMRTATLRPTATARASSPLRLWRARLRNRSLQKNIAQPPPLFLGEQGHGLLLEDIGGKPDGQRRPGEKQRQPRPGRGLGGG